MAWRTNPRKVEPLCRTLRFSCSPQRGDVIIMDNLSSHKRASVRDLIEAAGACLMAKAIVRTLKRGYVRVSPRPDARMVTGQLPGWIAHGNEVHPNRALAIGHSVSTPQKPARSC